MNMKKLSTEEMIMLDVALGSHIEALQYTIDNSFGDLDIEEGAKEEMKEYEALREKIYTYGNKY